MWITAGVSSFALTVFLNSIELICSDPMTLEDLFPGYSGVIPPVKEFLYTNQFLNFRAFNNRTIVQYRGMRLVRRDHIIFGWWFISDRILGLGTLIPDSEDVFIAFDINEERWITLPRNLSRKLGAERRLDSVVARDEVAATHVTTSTDPRHKAAHIRACKEANDQADIVEREQAQLLYEEPSNVGNSIRVIKEEYSQSYDRAFMLYLHPHGEYNIHGYRKRHL